MLIRRASWVSRRIFQAAIALSRVRAAGYQSRDRLFCVTSRAPASSSVATLPTRVVGAFMRIMARDNHTAAHAHQIVDLVPNKQQSFHGSEAYKLTARPGVP